MNAILHTSNFSTASKLVNKIKNMHNDLSDTQQKVHMGLGHLQNISSDLKQNKHLLNAVKQDEMKKDRVKNNIDKFVKNLKNKVGGSTIQELKNTKNQLDQFTQKTSIIYHKYQSYYNTFRSIESKSKQIINKLSLLTTESESEFQQRKEEYLDELNVLICKQVHFHEQYVDMNLKYILFNNKRLAAYFKYNDLEKKQAEKAKAQAEIFVNLINVPHKKHKLQRKDNIMRKPKIQTPPTY